MAGTLDERKVLMIVCALGVAVLSLDMIQGGNLFDLAAAYAQRSDRATDLLQGAESLTCYRFNTGVAGTDHNHVIAFWVDEHS